MSVISLISSSMSVIEKYMDKTPNYPQKKREEFFRIKNSLDNEMKKEYPLRDDDLIMNIRDEYILFAETFAKEIS